MRVIETRPFTEREMNLKEPISTEHPHATTRNSVMVKLTFSTTVDGERRSGDEWVARPLFDEGLKCLLEFFGNGPEAAAKVYTLCFDQLNILDAATRRNALKEGHSRNGSRAMPAIALRATA